MESIFTPETERRIEADYRAAEARLAPFHGKIGAVLGGLDRTETFCLKFCLAFMPIQDLIGVSFSIVVRVIRHTLRLAERDPEVRSLPPDIFLNFLLFYRVNNEKIEFNRDFFYDALRERIEGKPKREAILAVNDWCGERVTYRATDERTASPLTTLRRGFGRCGEESTFLVSALRSVGIPARQIYTPRWAHCDDNHAWVEAYADGEWFYMGACEPEPRLDKGWFTASASKAILIQAQSFGTRFENEIVSSSTDITSLLNRTAKYGATRRLTVRVSWDGKAAVGTAVRFEIVNYGELYPVLTAKTDANGIVSAEFGRGTVHLSAVEADRAAFGFTTLTEDREVSLTLRPWSELTGYDFVQRPPSESFRAASETEVLTPDRAARIRRCAASIEAFETALAENPRLAAFRASSSYQARFEPFLLGARGNLDEVIDFLADAGFSADEKFELLGLLREKDLVDITAAALRDGLRASRPVRALYPEDVYRRGVLSLRVANETLVPERAEIQALYRGWGLNFSSGAELYADWRERIRIEQRASYSDLSAGAADVLRNGIADPNSARIAFVKAARSLGFAADLDPVTGVPRVWADGAFRPLVSDADEVAAPEARWVWFESADGSPMSYWRNLTIQRFEEAGFQTLNYTEPEAAVTARLTVPDGFYRIVTGTRQLDGSVKTSVRFVAISAAGPERIPVTVPTADPLTTFFRYVPIGETALRMVSGGPAIVPVRSDSGEVLAFVDVGSEPTEHFFNELLEAEDEIRRRAVPITLVLRPEDDLNQRTFRCVSETFPSVRACWAADAAAESRLHQLMNAGDERRPFILAIDSEGRGLYSFSNYNVGTVRLVSEILAVGAKDGGGMKEGQS